MDIALIGYGNMGQLVRARAEARRHTVNVIISEAHADLAAEQLSETLRTADVAIDFSSARAVRRNVEACLAAGIPIVEGTTGWNSEREAIERLVLQHGGAMIFGSNFSVGVNLFFRVAEFAATLFAKFPEYEAFIEEQHHSKKVDAPSGTALKLRELVAEHIHTDLSITATRAGNIPGTHRLGFDGNADHIVLEHLARSRESFAHGAIMASEWINKKEGFYEFSDVLEEMLTKH
jgi:4-hydroxy-tetrahydrodipicolinate reductase